MLAADPECPYLDLEAGSSLDHLRAASIAKHRVEYCPQFVQEIVIVADAAKVTGANRKTIKDHIKTLIPVKTRGGEARSAK